MSRDRALLHKTKLDDFRAWLIAQGYEIRKLPCTFGFYEVLRWRGVSGEPMPIIFDRHDATEHYTCNASAVRYVRRWLNERKS